MLLLDREIGESIVIDGGAIVLTVIKLSNKRVRIGFTADRSITILREELLDDKRHRNSSLRKEQRDGTKSP